jgi:hypothetical protein
MLMTTHYFSRYASWCAATLLVVCTASIAQTADTRNAGTDNAADPKAKVPEVAYRSVFKETSLGVEKDTNDWRKANDEVGKFTRGHLDILKWEEQQNAKPAATKPIAAPAHKH